jgi:hypothetical protein
MVLLYFAALSLIAAFLVGLWSLTNKKLAFPLFIFAMALVCLAALLGCMYILRLPITNH